MLNNFMVLVRGGMAKDGRVGARSMQHVPAIFGVVVGGVVGSTQVPIARSRRCGFFSTHVAGSSMHKFRGV